jgi:GrpB-like predicted nucleotidyltransferase (UPF0157 family)
MSNIQYPPFPHISVVLVIFSCYNAVMADKVMRLIGEIKVGGVEWTLEEYRSLFERLGNVPEPGVVTRLVRYFGTAGGHIEARFLGVESDTADIPDDMVALELGEDTITVRRPGIKKPWRASLKWEWLDRSTLRAPVGDFRACVPPGWTSQKVPQPLTFIITANACFTKSQAADDDVRLVEYDTAWPVQYEAMADWLRKTIPRGILRRVEHFGSTSIPGMPAKPVIDILLEVPSLREARRNLIPIFNQPECEYWGYDDHVLFIKRKEFMGTRTYHIHAAPSGGRFWERIAFRDYLRTHPDDAKRYADLKYELSGRYNTDREAYTDAKGVFVQEIVDKAVSEINVK